MPEMTFLHIQGSEAEATRVFEMPGGAVRVGRGALCEVRLAEPNLADVQCLIRRRGETWLIQPVGPAGLVSIDGIPVDHVRPLPMGVPIQVGAYRLVLRPDDWGTFEPPYEVPTSSRADLPANPVTIEAAPDEPIGPGDGLPSSVGEAGLDRSPARVEQRERWLQSRQKERKWEARWKAAGEGLRTRSVSSTPLLPTASQALADRVGVSRSPTPSRPGPARVAPASVVPSVPPKPALQPPVDPPEPRGLTTLPRSATPAPGPPAPRSEPGPPVLPFEPRIVALPAIEPPAPADPGDETSPLPEPAGDPSPSTIPISRADVIPESKGESSRFAVLEPPPVAESASVGETEPGVASRSPGELLAEPTAFFSHARPTSTVFWHQEAYRPDDVAGRNPHESRPNSHGEATSRSIDPGIVAATRPTPGRAEFPSAASIFAAQGTRAVPEPPRATKSRSRVDRRPMPTDPLAPEQWSMPFWLAGPPAFLVAAGMVGVGLILGVYWTKDNLDAGIAARAALRDEKSPPIPLDPAMHPDSRWWKTTPGHLAHWAAAIERSPDSSDRASEVRDMLDAAHRASPLQAEVRLALAQALPGQDAPHPSRSVGLSRDVVSLTLTGRALKRAGKVEPALRAYRKALEIAAEADPARLPSPLFDDDSRARRYRLPREAMVAPVVRDIVEAGGWDFAVWSRALPPRAVVRLAVGRFLRDKESVDADRAFDLALGEDVGVPADPDQAAEHHASQAEALAFKERKSEAADRYRRAIALATDDPTRRRWQLALAEIIAPLGASRERAELLEAAKGPDPTEEITRKALEAQKFSGLK
jgi:tetratricopeptide (TPR) repeat protein